MDINVGNISVGNYFVQEVFRRFFHKWKSPFKRKNACTGARELGTSIQREYYHVG